MAETLAGLVTEISKKLADLQSLLSKNKLTWRTLSIALLTDIKEDIETVLELTSPGAESITDTPVSILKIQREQAQVRLASVVDRWNNVKKNIGGKSKEQIQQVIHLADELLTCLQLG